MCCDSPCYQRVKLQLRNEGSGTFSVSRWDHFTSVSGIAPGYRCKQGRFQSGSGLCAGTEDWVQGPRLKHVAVSPCAELSLVTA